MCSVEAFHPELPACYGRYFHLPVCEGWQCSRPKWNLTRCVLAGWCTCCTLAPWMMPSSFWNPSCLQKPGSVISCSRIQSWTECLKIAADVFFFFVVVVFGLLSPSALLGLVSPSAIGLERFSVLSASPMQPLWRLSCTSPGPKFSRWPGDLWQNRWLNLLQEYIKCNQMHKFFGVCLFFFIPLQILPEVLHLCLPTGGTEYPLHGAVIRQ